jgi:hypothetical protein
VEKSQQDLNQLKLDFAEEKVINQQLINNQHELRDEMKRKDKVKSVSFLSILV